MYNMDFKYEHIPYGEDSNLMYNSGSVWGHHLQHVVDLLLKDAHRWDEGNIIDIGCGDGQFFSLLKSQYSQARCIGFEPGIDAKKITDFPVVQDYFIPERDLKKYRPSPWAAMGHAVSRHSHEPETPWPCQMQAARMC
jgi:hypothetical protein